jgi:xanthine dehydrogenase accessory factor
VREATLPEPPMSSDKSILICGIGETASAVARRLYVDGYAVALYRAAAPLMLRRRMSFADAWHDGHALLEGVEARRADVNVEFQLGLRTRAFIPLLRSRYSDALENWPWDVVVAAHEDREPAPLIAPDDAELTIGLGASFRPGVDCDLVIDADGPDPGAVRRMGHPPQKRARAEAPQSCLAPAPVSGLFRAEISIGASVQAGATLGFVDDVPVLAPASGRLLGVARREQAVVEGAPVAEIATALATQVSGVSFANQLVARGVSFAIEMELEGFEPFSFEDWF